MKRSYKIVDPRGDVVWALHPEASSEQVLIKLNNKKQTDEKLILILQTWCCIG